MANPEIHSKSSVKRWGGKIEDYIAIHELIDSPKATMNNNSSRALTPTLGLLIQSFQRYLVTT